MTNKILNSFNESGFLHLETVLSESRVETLRNEISKLYEFQKEQDGRSEKLKDISEYESLRSILVEPTIINTVKSILGEDIVYIKDSAIHKGEGIAGWHKDIRHSDRYDFNTDDWAEDYSIVRVGIYLQDTVNTSGGLMIKLGSHNPKNWIKKIVNKANDALRNTNNNLLKSFLNFFIVQVIRACGKSAFFNNKKGDIGIWSLRTTHSGGAKRLKIFSDYPLDPFISKKLPSFIFKSEVEERMVLFFAYGKKDKHLNNYYEYLKGRDDYSSKYGNEIKLSDSAKKFLHDNGIDS